MIDRKFKTKMKVLLLLTIFNGTMSIRRLPHCHACFEGICFSRSTIFSAHKFSGQIAVDHTSNVLYFHYQTNNSVDFTGAYDLKEIKFYIIPNVGYTFGRAVDQSTNDMYMSSILGLYKYNPHTKTVKQIGLAGKTLWQMHYKDVLYYSEFRSKGLYTYFKNKSKSIPALSNYQIDEFVIDKKNDIYFMSDSIIYRLRNGTKNAEFFIDEVFSLATDNKGNVHFIQSATRAVYVLDYSKDSMTEIGAFGRGTPARVAFDADNNMIYHDVNNERIYYLAPNYNLCTVSTKGRGKHSRKFVALKKSHKDN